MKASTFNKGLLTLAVATTIAEAMLVGANLQSGDFDRAIGNGAVLVLWVVILIFNYSMSIADAKHKVRHEMIMEKLDGAIADAKKKLVEPIKKREVEEKEDPLEVEFEEIFDRVVGKGKKPTRKQMADIKKEFESNTGHELRIEMLPGEIGLHIQFGRKPMKKES